MELYIRNMVCNRCIMVVRELLEAQKLHPAQILLGEVTIAENNLSPIRLQRLAEELEAKGFELIDNQRSRLIESIKNLIVRLVHYTEPITVKYSVYLAEQLQQDYTMLSKLFSEVEGITIEQYIIRQKIERVKELLVYDELSLGTIAEQLGYSSVAHLSAQFKKVTGLTPSFYKQKGAAKRLPLDQV